MVDFIHTPSPLKLSSLTAVAKKTSSSKTGQAQSLLPQSAPMHMPKLAKPPVLRTGLRNARRSPVGWGQALKGRMSALAHLSRGKARLQTRKSSTTDNQTSGGGDAGEDPDKLYEREFLPRIGQIHDLQQQGKRPDHHKILQLSRELDALWDAHDQDLLARVESDLHRPIEVDETQACAFRNAYASLVTAEASLTAATQLVMTPMEPSEYQKKMHWLTQTLSDHLQNPWVIAEPSVLMSLRTHLQATMGLHNLVHLAAVVTAWLDEEKKKTKHRRHREKYQETDDDFF